LESAIMALPVNKSDLPPMMLRYVEYKERYPDAVLFFQVGDFFELFFDDAVTVARALNLTLTSRDKNNPNPIPMCGIPLSVIDSYVDRLLPLGHSVAIVTQTGSGQGVDRALERFVTPGMRLFSSVASDPTESLISAVAVENEERGASVAYCDPQTGVVSVREAIDVAALPHDLSTLMVREVVVPRSSFDQKIDRRTSWVRRIEAAVGEMSLRFRPEPTVTVSSLPALQGDAEAQFHALSPCSKWAVRQLLAYLDEISLGNLVPVRELRIARDAGHMIIDSATRKNLELVQNAKDGSTVGTLYGFLNSTTSPGGARLLRSWLLHPLCDVDEITVRLSTVRALKQVAGPLRTAMQGLSDIERLTARIQLKLASPRDLVAVRDVLERLPTIRRSIEGVPSSILSQTASSLTVSPALGELLSRALVDNPPHLLTDGGVIREGFSEELDHIRTTRATADAWREQFELRERQSTGISSLKVKSNNVIGFFMEITSAHAAKVPTHYLRRQSTANADRYTTPELKEHEQAIITAVDRQIRKEQELFNELRGNLLPFVEELRTVGSALAVLDVLSTLAVVADRHGLVEPTVVSEPILEITDGRHPVVAELLEGRFVPNSLQFSLPGPSCYLITGPNMGGKSTYLRQAAVITILAQIGSFVPAHSATVGIADRVFARLGASDDLHEGESTFMVEMREAAHILSSATESSLVLIDELGRGTATSDGLSLARAILEQLVQKLHCRTLFATHFHELTALAASTPGVANLSVGSVEDGDRVIFTHEINSGPAPRSYGLEVAKLSGLPAEVIERAYEFLAAEPVGSRSQGSEERSKQIALFERRGEMRENPLFKVLSAKIQDLDPDALTPREALSALYELRSILPPVKKSSAGAL
jgi:DNA mismatch repair protein MutS